MTTSSEPTARWSRSSAARERRFGVSAKFLAVVTGAALAAALVGCTLAAPEEKPNVLTLEAAQETARSRLGAIRAEELMRFVALERFERRRQLELPGLLAHSETASAGLKLRLLDEARAYCTVLTLVPEGVLDEVRRRFSDPQLDREIASRFCELDSPAGADPVRRRELELELAIALGIPSRELPALDFSRLAGPDAPLPPEDPAFARFVSDGTWSGPDAELRFARLLFQLPTELALREKSDPDAPPPERIARLAERIGAGFQSRILRADAAAAAERRRQALARGDRDAADRALLDWRLARCRLAAVSPGETGEFSAADLRCLREVALLTGE